MIAPVIANSQNFSLPTSILDSLLWETERGRSCEVIRKLQANHIDSLGLEILANGKAIKLLESKSLTRDQLLKNMDEYVKLGNQEFALKEKGLKRKLRKRNGTIIIEGIAIIGLILLL